MPTTTRTTSAAARAKAKPALSKCRMAILKYLDMRGDYGATRDELSSRLGMPIQTVCPTLHWLVDRKLAINTEATRTTRHNCEAIVVVISPEGQEFIDTITVITTGDSDQ
jgi:predicted transcriptional regulator